MILRSRAIALGVGLLIPLGASGCAGRGGEKAVEASTAPKAVPVTVATLERRGVERTIDVEGSLRGWEDVTVGSKVVGRVAHVHHDMGDHVKPGALLVDLETTDADLAITQAERRLEVELARLGLKEMPGADFDIATIPTVVQARLALEKARNNLARERSLAHRNAGTAENLQNAENDERSNEAALGNTILTARANLANAHAARVAVDVARQARADLAIHAPNPSIPPPDVTEPLTFAVATRSVSEGQMVKEGEAAFELVVENPLRLRVNVPEEHSPAVQLGQPVRVTVKAYPGQTFEGKVARINPAIDTANRTFQVEVAIPNNRGMLRPGGFAKASIVTDRNAEASVAPIESIVTFAGVTKLFVVEDGQARAINVRTIESRLESPGWVEVVGDLPARAQVVTTGQTQLADGTAVVVRAPEPTPAAAPVAAAKDGAPKAEDR